MQLNNFPQKSLVNNPCLSFLLWVSVEYLRPQTVSTAEASVRCTGQDKRWSLASHLDVYKRQVFLTTTNVGLDIASRRPTGWCVQILHKRCV